MVRRRGPLLALALVWGGLWWWAVLRMALTPGQAGLVEGAVAAGGWGLSLLPVHVASARRTGGVPAEFAPQGPAGVAGHGGPSSGAGVRAAGAAGGSVRAAGGGPVARTGGGTARAGGGPVRAAAGSGAATGLARAVLGRIPAAARVWLRRRGGGGSGRS
ncbi:hypothetical protein PUR26_04240 [Streptomyces sp. SP18CS02]|nr:hypothetical protein [Streptomyces sp. SP18CS02]MEE1751704.1 hypothetical protein [Streptomyces sp. SP18CS02]